MLLQGNHDKRDPEGINGTSTWEDGGGCTIKVLMDIGHSVMRTIGVPIYMTNVII